MHDQKPEAPLLNPEVTRLKPKKRVGLVVVITGYGKGKTSSAVGMLVRACGHGMRVCMIQFMKGDLYTGEWDGIRRLACEVELIPAGMGFCGIEGNPYPHSVHREAAQRAIGLAEKKIDSGRFDLVILDEVNNALKLRLVDLDQVLNLIQRKPSLMHLILTGRDAHPDIIQLADTVSEVQEIKHAYRRNIEPQPGIDF
ncbi:cob(I)yrinic acid a,c-diamide adenosyltransferase [Desulfoferrobacter suflitae]|uniref:cob(I)yrinic acid a,c-diamide adenosyltransferase n=1 Tax=Desulfoferrobacter suflitae TaxID=2865782 RepID=UPI0021648B9C|nr:cob(I)yrinic acid a,c-diamide adenosyltransferase [Desulfoferrobacter suflitae]MCK8601679.1 cob(I)yrinic acid a,c-diamide adenosyltransferase [Desulfoferrobacter suflitae]